MVCRFPFLHLAFASRNPNPIVRRREKFRNHGASNHGASNHGASNHGASNHGDSFLRAPNHGDSFLRAPNHGASNHGAPSPRANRAAGHDQRRCRRGFTGREPADRAGPAGGPRSPSGTGAWCGCNWPGRTPGAPAAPRESGCRGADNRRGVEGPTGGNWRGEPARRVPGWWSNLRRPEIPG